MSYTAPDNSSNPSVNNDVDAAQERLDRVLSKLDNVKKYRSGGRVLKWTARCPVHGDNENSLTVSLDTEDGRIGVFCYAGCTPAKDKHRLDRFLEATGLSYRDLFTKPAQVQEQATQGQGRADDSVQGCTLDAISEAKYIHPRILDFFGVEEVQYRGKTILKIPYADALGVIHPRYRLRWSVDKGKRRFTWAGPDDAQPIAYGLQTLPKAQELGYMVLCEGESDVWTLAHYGIPAVGLPGAEMADKLEDEYLTGIDTVYIIDECDTGGPAFVKGLKQRLRDLEYRGVVRVVQLAPRYGVKDPNALHVQAAQAVLAGKNETFKSQFQAALDGAILLQDWIELSEEDQDEDRPRLKSADYVIKMPPPKWLVGGILEEAGLHLVLGAPNSGKSFIALDWACRVATGLDWQGRATKQGKVIYAASEGLAGYQKRLRAWLGHNGWDLYDPLVSSLFYVEGDVNIMDTKRNAQLLELVTTMDDVKLVIIDTLAEAMPGADENTSRDIGVFLDLSRKIRRHTGAAVVVVHHSPKSGDGARGHTSLPGAMDLRYDVKPVEGEKGLLTVKCEKNRNGAKDYEQTFRLEQVILSEEMYDTSCVLIPIEAAVSDAPQALNGVQEKVYQVLQFHGRLTSGSLLKYCEEQGVTKSTLYNNTHAMEKMGIITVEATGPGRPTYYSLAPEYAQA